MTKAIIQARTQNEHLQDVLVLFDIDACTEQAMGIIGQWDFKSHPFATISVPLASSIELYPGLSIDLFSEHVIDVLYEGGSHIGDIPEGIPPIEAESFKLKGETINVSKHGFWISFYEGYGGTDYSTPSITLPL